MDSDSPSAPSSSPRIPPSSWIRTGVLIAVLAVLVAAAYVVLSSEWFRHVQSAQSVPDELHTARFIAAQPGEAPTVYGLSTFGFTRQKTDPQPELAAAFSKEANRGKAKRNAVVTPDGTRVGFAQLISSETERSPRAWQVVVTDVGSTSQHELDHGFAVMLLNPKKVARLTAEGVLVTDLETGEEMRILDYPFISALTEVSVSPDNSLIAWRVPGKQSTVVYAVTETEATLVATYDAPHDSFALSDQALYALRNTAEGTQVVRYRLGEGAAEEVLHTLPASLGITAISFTP